MDDLLHLVQDLLAAFRVEFRRLFLEQLIEVRVAAIRIDAALHGEYFEARRGVAERSAAALDQVLELLLGITLPEAARSIGRKYDLIPISARLFTTTSPRFAYEESQ